MRSILVVMPFLIVGCQPPSQRADQNNEAQANATGPLLANSNTMINDSAPAPPPAPQSEWRYDTRSDPMTDRATRTACVWSSNEAVLGFPYGSTRAELCLRDSPQFGRDAYVALEGQGQILCMSFQDCTVRVRFDGDEMGAYPAVGPSDNSTNIIFIRARDRLERGLRSADRTAIQIEFYQAGQQALIFPTTGFNWPDAGEATGGRRR